MYGSGSSTCGQPSQEYGRVDSGLILSTALPPFYPLDLRISVSNRQMRGSDQGFNRLLVAGYSSGRWGARGALGWVSRWRNGMELDSLPIRSMSLVTRLPSVGQSQPLASSVRIETVLASVSVVPRATVF